MDLQGKFVIPGYHIGVQQESLKLGEGVFLKNNNLFASVAGKIKIDSEEVKEGETYHTISIQSNIENQAPCLALGQIIIGKVVRIKEDLCTIKIMQINGKTINTNLEGVLRKQNIRESEVDKLIMEYSFLPGDIVKAKIISLGDSQKVFLSTVGDEFGVIFAKDQETQNLMMPYNWNSMISMQTGLKEYRKVAKPNLDLFQQDL